MRKEFSAAIEKISAKDESIIFITGDLGYNAFECLQQSLGNRFINAGVAEQNMVSVAAGMASHGYKVFCYSIAPFIVYRCLEQFRNDVCMHNLPVFLVGNGGGYGYGIMGPTHHALEDIGCMSSMQNVKCWVPSFNDEVEIVLKKIITEKKPTYLRLNNSQNAPAGFSSANCINSVIKSSNPKATIISTGPVINNVIKSLANKNISGKCNLFSASYFPLELSDEFILSVNSTNNLLVVEEHVSAGGLAQQLSLKLLENRLKINKFVSLHARGYPNGLFGDQHYHQEQSGIDADNISKVLTEMF
ncbi:MAG: transketolase [Bacteroidetes bacterium]|nr:transketolase [Bacteroidota bacterium]